MNISELHSLVYWISSEIEDAQIQQKYQALQQILQQHSQGNQQSPLESEKNELIRALGEVALDNLTKDQIAFLHDLGIAQAVGNEGIGIIEDILYKNVIDVATSANRVQEIINNIAQGVKRAGQIKTGLKDCEIEEQYELDNEILMRISFAGCASMANVSDFKCWGNIWYDIGRGIAMAHNASPEDIKIVGATKGSIIIELAVAAGIATTTSSIILAALKVAEKVLDIRKKAEELKELKLKNGKLARELEKEAENEKKSGIEEITASVSKQLSLKDGEGDKANALDVAVKNLVDFIEKGGEIDFVIPDDETEEQEGDHENLNDLRVAFQEIRQLEKKITLLEDKNN